MALQEELEKQGNFLFRYRGVLPILIVIPAIAVMYFGAPVPESEQKEIYHYIYYSIALFGLAIRFYTVGIAAKNTSGRNTSEGQVADTVNRTGIYSICRHPLYIGNFFMWLGVALLTHNTWFILFFILLYWFYYERIMFAEEQYLRAKFGTMYTDWAANTPAILPAFRQWKSSENPFSLKKAMKQEKTGFLLLNLVFLIFNCIPFSDFTGIWQEKKVWVFILVVGIAYYIVVKMLEKTTSLFNTH